MKLNERHKEVSHKEVSHKEVSHKEVSHKEVSHKEVFHKEVSHKEVYHKEVSHKEVSHKEVSHKEVSPKEVSHKEVSHCLIKKIKLNSSTTATSVYTIISSLTPYILPTEYPDRLDCYDMEGGSRGSPSTPFLCLPSLNYRYIYV